MHRGQYQTPHAQNLPRYCTGIKTDGEITAAPARAPALFAMYQAICGLTGIAVNAAGIPRTGFKLSDLMNRGTRTPGNRRAAAAEAAALMDGPFKYSPSASLAIICPCPQFRPRNSHKARTKYTIGRARQQSAPLLPSPGYLDDLIDQLRRGTP